MDRQALLAFFLFAFVAAATPGPSNLMVMATAARSGLNGGLRCLAGVVTGMALLMAFAATSLQGVLRVVPQLLPAMKLAGALLLLWLSWKIATAPVSRTAASDAGAVGFCRALLFQWVNPKAWIVAGSAAASYGAAIHPDACVRALALGLTFALAAAPATAIWLAFGAALQRWLVDARLARRWNRAMGVLLATSVFMVLA